VARVDRGPKPQGGWSRSHRQRGHPRPTDAVGLTLDAGNRSGANIESMMARARIRFEPNDEGVRRLAESVADEATAATNQALAECTAEMTVDQVVQHVSSVLQRTGVEPTPALRELVEKYMKQHHGVE
jgi:hypothetical protein